MTRREIIIQILCEHTGESREFYETIMNTMSKNNKIKENLSLDLPDKESKLLIEQIKLEVTELQALFRQLDKTNRVGFVLPNNTTIH